MRLPCARILIFLALALIACGPKAATRLRGHWVGSRVVGLTPGWNAAAANRFALTVELDVREKDLTMSYEKDGKRSSYISPYLIVKEQGPKLVVKTNSDTPGQSLELSDDGSLSWAMSNDMVIVFEKSPPK